MLNHLEFYQIPIRRRHEARKSPSQTSNYTHSPLPFPTNIYWNSQLGWDMASSPGPGSYEVRSAEGCRRCLTLPGLDMGHSTRLLQDVQDVVRGSCRLVKSRPKDVVKNSWPTPSNSKVALFRASSHGLSIRNISSRGAGYAGLLCPHRVTASHWQKVKGTLKDHPPPTQG